MSNQDFYIGWQPEVPAKIARRVRLAVIFILLLVPMVAALVVSQQRALAKSSFEYGQASTLEGVLTMRPAPFLQVFRGTDLSGQHVFQNVLLVGAGKHGAGEMLAATERQKGHSLEGKRLKISGFLIYHDGKTLLEVEHMEHMNEQSSEPSQSLIPNPQSLIPQKLGSGALTGEITDPKCLFGVMNPGEGKPHRSCAARCIAGGIPPVLKTISADGQTQYYLLAGESGEPLNREVLPFVGDAVRVCGDIYRLGDWLLLYKDATKGISLVEGRETAAVQMCN